MQGLRPHGPAAGVPQREGGDRGRHRDQSGEGVEAAGDAGRVRDAGDRDRGHHAEGQPERVRRAEDAPGPVRRHGAHQHRPRGDPREAEAERRERDHEQQRGQAERLERDQRRAGEVAAQRDLEVVHARAGSLVDRGGEQDADAGQRVDDAEHAGAALERIDHEHDQQRVGERDHDVADRVQQAETGERRLRAGLRRGSDRLVIRDRDRFGEPAERVRARCGGHERQSVEEQQRLDPEPGDQEPAGGRGQQRARLRRDLEARVEAPEALVAHALLDQRVGHGHEDRADHRQREVRQVGRAADRPAEDEPQRQAERGERRRRVAHHCQRAAVEAVGEPAAADREQDLRERDRDEQPADGERRALRAEQQERRGGELDAVAEARDERGADEEPFGAQSFEGH
jgi:hypothetical protein